MSDLRKATALRYRPGRTNKKRSLPPQASLKQYYSSRRISTTPVSFILNKRPISAHFFKGVLPSKPLSGLLWRLLSPHERGQFKPISIQSKRSLKDLAGGHLSLNDQNFSVAKTKPTRGSLKTTIIAD